MINEQNIATIFNEKMAANYDRSTEMWSAGRDAIFSFMRLILTELPAQARVLCVGVGTGTEMIALAQAFPQWQFTAVEPAPAMLEVCRQKAHASGIAARCTFHEGFLESLPESGPFDASTCLLVSHFFSDAKKRSDFFHQIASRLRPGGILISSDLVLGMAPAVYRELLEVWVRMLRGSGSSEEQIERLREVYGRELAALPVSEVESIIMAGGFETPVLFSQTLLIHAWFSRRATSVDEVTAAE